MVAFAEGRAVFIVSTIEGEPQQIATGPGEPHGWSPGQRSVLLGEGAEGRGRVFVIDLDTLDEQTLASDAGVGGASSPSPRWDRVAYTAIPNEQADVFVVGMDGAPAVNLTDHPANDYFPAWSPCLGGG
jgi:TolB protein